MRVLKGHGTENDFVLLPDLDGRRPLTPELAQALCDRHAGIGADGVLRVVRSDAEPDAGSMAAEASYFMDYRNADGSLAEMCGNGVRVFARYLRDAGLIGDRASIATRAGVRRVELRPDADIVVEMGVPQLLPERPLVTVAYEDHPRPALASVRMPNPHVVVHLADRDSLDRLDLSRPPHVDLALPTGQNVEFVVTVAARHLAMRVHERGVGETRSCGTGICAVVAAVAVELGSGADGQPWRVDVPGGTCEVLWRADGEILLSGPAVIVGEVELRTHWLARLADPAERSQP
jgi:diaminopimelate epimerase